MRRTTIDINILPRNSPAPRGDSLTMTIPLFLKLLEWAREDAKKDKDLHVLAEEFFRKSQGGKRMLDINDFTQGD